VHSIWNDLPAYRLLYVCAVGAVGNVWGIQAVPEDWFSAP